MDSIDMDDREFSEELDEENPNFEYFMRKTSGAASMKKHPKSAKRLQKKQNYGEVCDKKDLQLHLNKLTKQVNQLPSKIHPTHLHIIDNFLSINDELF